MSKHTVAISLDDTAYRVLKAQYGQLLQDPNVDLGGRSGPGTILTEAVYHLLGVEDHPENPIIVAFIAR
jgi:hypothetical protein